MKTFILAFVFLMSLAAVAQTATDTLIWNDGTTYYGKLEKKSRGELQFRTKDGQLHYVSTSSVSQVRLADGSGNALTMQAPRDTTGDAAAAARKALRKSEMDSLKQASAEEYPSVDWSDPTLPKYIVRKHRTGIGLSVTGAALMVGGIGMLAGGLANNGQTTTYSNGYSAGATVNVGAIGVVGILSIIAGLPMVIVGAVKATKARRLALTHQKYPH